MEHIHDAGVVQLTVGLQQGNQHGIFAPLLKAILVQLLQEVLVLVLGAGAVVLIFHLKHDGDDLGAWLVQVAKNVVALAAGPGVVVFLKISAWKRCGANTVELRLAVLLQRLAHHLGGQARLHVAQALYRIIAVFDLRLVLVFEGFFCKLFFKLSQRQAILQLIAFPLDPIHSLGDRQLLY